MQAMETAKTGCKSSKANKLQVHKTEHKTVARPQQAESPARTLPSVTELHYATPTSLAPVPTASSAYPVSRQCPAFPLKFPLLGTHLPQFYLHLKKIQFSIKLLIKN